MLHIWLAFAVIALAMVLYLSERVSMEATSLLTIVLLMAVFHIHPLIGADGENLLGASNLLLGLASPALITIIALLIMGQGLFLSGALERVIAQITAWGGRHRRTALGAVLLCVAALSAFLNNTPVVLMGIPLVIAVVKRIRAPFGGQLMALSYIAILGGMVTLIGSSTNLLVAGAVMRSGAGEMGLFSQSIPGLFMASIGALYVLFVMPLFLPHGAADKHPESVPDSGRQYIIEWQLGKRDALRGEKIIAGMIPALQGTSVQMIESGGRAMLPPFDEHVFRAGDKVFLAATRRELANLLADPNHALARHIRPKLPSGKAETLLAEAVIPPGARIIGQTATQAARTLGTDCHIVGVQRHRRMLRHKLDNIRLAAGDVLLLAGRQADIEALRHHRDILVVEWSASELPDFGTAQRARWIFGLSIAAAMSGFVPIVLAALGGATAMVLTHVLTLRQATRSIDPNIVLLIAAAMAMGEALSATGGATYLASQFLWLFTPQSTALTLSAFFLLCALATNLISNNATAVLFTPIALNLAEGLHAPPAAFTLAVIFAANCSFLTPMAYQTNLLIMGPGNYRFGDFLRGGFPLLLILWLAYSLFAPWYFNFN